MGLLDDVLCNSDLFCKHKGETHYTKSLNPAVPGSMYEITPAGRLELLECTYEDRSDPNAPGWRRFEGMMTPVLTGQRSDAALHGSVVLQGFGRAIFREGTLVAFERESDHLLDRNQPSSAGVLSRSTPVLKSTLDAPGCRPADYLRSFFSELERLKCRLICDVSHAIGFRDGKLYVLISVGDYRERVYVQDLDPDPASAAQDVFLQWRTTPRVDGEIELVLR